MPSNITIDGYEAVTPLVLDLPRTRMFPMEYWGECNSITLPRGRSPGEACLLFKKTAVDAISWSTAKTIVLTDNNGSTISLNGYFLEHVEAVTQTTGNDQIYFVRLQDRRKIGELKAVEPTTDTSSAVSWTSLLSMLWPNLPLACRGGSTSAPAFAVAPSSVPEHSYYYGSTQWEAVCRALTACGHVPVFNPNTDSYSFVDPTGTQAGLATFYSSNTSNLIWDAQTTAAPAGNCPENVTIFFPDSRSASYTYLMGHAPPYSTSLATGISGAQAGTNFGFVDCSRAIYDRTGAISNATALSNRVTDLSRVVTGVALSVSNSSLRVYRDFLSIFPGEQVTEVSWKIDGISTTTSVRYDGKWEFDLPYSVIQNPGCPHRLYRYTLTGPWASPNTVNANAQADISHPDGYPALPTSSTVFDPMMMFQDQVFTNTGRRSGYCVFADGRFYCIQAPC